MMFEAVFSSINVDQVNKSLRIKGFHVFDVRLSSEYLKDVIQQMDDICSNKDDLEINYGGSEHRLWYANKFMPAAEEFRQFSNAVIPKLEGGMPKAHNVLAIRNKPLGNNKGELRKGRWHLDSFKKQLKIFVLLQDVGPNDGPFELIPQTHKMPTKIKHAIQAKYFRIADFIERTGKRGYQHIDDGFIDYVERSYPTQIFTVPAGTILVADTSAIHRAHPVNGGERYAFTSYH